METAATGPIDREPLQERRHRRLRRYSATWAAVRRPRTGDRDLDTLELAAHLALPAPADDHLRLFTLNVAHGRRTGPHQALQNPHRVRRNVAAIGTLLRKLEPHVVALQEADGPSPWSGNFDHVETLAELAGLPTHFRGEHNPLGVGRFRLASGTALLARQPLLDPTSHRFGMSWRDTKGFVTAAVEVPAWGGTPVDVVSVHLDFLTPRLRRQQIERLVELVGDRGRPLVVLGDLNCCWQYEPESLELLSEALGLRAYKLDHSTPTFPSFRPLRRLDWVLISAELDFARHETVALPLSDHLGVVADLALRPAS